MTDRSSIAILVQDATIARGTERAAINLANALALHGYRVGLVSLFSAHGPTAFTLHSDIKIIHLDQRRDVSNNLQRLFKLIKTTRSLRIPTAQYATLIASEDMLTFNSLLLKLFRRHLNVIGWSHILYGNSPLILTFIRRFTFRYLNTLVVLNEGDLKSFGSDSIERIVKIPNMNSFPKLKIADYSQKRAIAVGTYTKDNGKGFDLLIRGSAPILRRHRDWKIMIIGKDVQGSELEQIAQKEDIRQQIDLLPVSTSISDMYQLASFCIMTSRQESFSLVITEAKSHSLATLAYDVSHGPRELIADETDGYLIPVGDEQLFGERLEQLITNEELRRKLGEAAGESSHAFSAEAVFHEWERLL